MARAKAKLPRRDVERQAKSYKAKRIDWLWEDRIPRGQISVVAGRPDNGKGLFTCLIAADVSKRGEEVIHSAVEDDPNRMTRPRLEAAGADLSKVWIWEFMLPKQLDELEHVVRERKPALVIIDPLDGHLAGVSKYSASIRRVTNPLKRLCSETGVAVVIVDHATKNVRKHSEPLSAIGGASSGLPAASRAGFILGKRPLDDDRVVVCKVKHNTSAKPDDLEYEIDVKEIKGVGDIAYLKYKGTTKVDPMLLLDRKAKTDAPKRGRKATERARAAKWLVNYLFEAKVPVPAATVLEDALQYQISNMTLKRAAKELKVIRKPASGPNVKWSLPDKLVKLATKSKEGRNA